MTERPGRSGAGAAGFEPVVIGAVVVAAVLTAVTAVTLVASRAAERPDDGGPPAALPVDPDGFLASWARSAAATYRMEGTLVRRRGDGELRLPVLVVERPPDHLRVQGGSIERRVGDMITVCGEAQVGGTCTTRTVPAPDVETLLRDRVSAMARLVAGEGPPYRVVADGAGCWLLGLLGGDPAPMLGTETRMCFDDATGAIRERRSQLGEVTEELRAERVTGTVTDADLRLASG